MKPQSQSLELWQTLITGFDGHGQQGFGRLLLVALPPGVSLPGVTQGAQASEFQSLIPHCQQDFLYRDNTRGQCSMASLYGWHSL